MLSDDDFRCLLQYFDRPWAGYRKVRKGVKKRLRRHMRDLGCKDVASYLDMVQKDAGLKAACSRHLSVTISRFFRDRQLWDYLMVRILPDLRKRFPGKLKAWSAGCAAGEEAYSLAIVWDRLAKGRAFLPSLSILATDCRDDILERAREGIYTQSSLKEIPQDIKALYFCLSAGGRRYAINPEIKERICWRQHNLLEKPPGQGFHIVFLRNNLLTYHQGEVLRRAFDRIVDTVVPGGYLIVGSHEKLPAGQRRLRRIEACPWLYQHRTIL